MDVHVAAKTSLTVHVLSYFFFLYICTMCVKLEQIMHHFKYTQRHKLRTTYSTNDCRGK